MAKEGISVQGKEIMDKLNNRSYTLYQIPCALYLQNGKVYYVGKNVHNQDPIESLESDADVPKTGAPNLKVEFYIRSSLNIGMINKNFFPSRGDLDRLSFVAWCPPYWKEFKEEKVKKFGNLLFEEATKKFHCTIYYNTEYYNMEYYLAHEDKTEKKLKCELTKRQIKDKRKQAQKELFYKLLLDIFGNVNEEDEKEEQEKQTIILKDFRLILDDGELKIGTAERGNHYIVVYYTLQY